MSELVEVKTIAEVERIVHGSGMWDGTGPVEFSNDGATWSETWAPSDEHPFPEFARVEVYRKDVRIPTRATIRWDEQVPRADEFWAGKWVGAPMRHFGRTVRMVGYRQTFREILGNIVIEDEDHAERTITTATYADAEPVVERVRDWSAEIAAAATLDVIDAIEKDARGERIFTPDAVGTALHRAFKARRRELQSVVVADAWAPVDHIEDPPSTPNHARPVTNDHLPPTNRAGRRKAARKKGRRR